MTVTEITELSKNRCKVYLDFQFAFVLYKGELNQYRIQEGAEFREEDYRIIMEELLPRRAKMRCMELLKSRDYTVFQLRQKLKQGFYPEPVIEETILYLTSCRYIDDLRYAAAYIASQEDSRSAGRIEQDLLVRGISRETIRQAWQQWKEEGGSQDEQGMIRRLLEKKHYDPGQTDRKEKQKLFAYLLRKGYSSRQIRQAMDFEEMDEFEGMDEF